MYLNMGTKNAIVKSCLKQKIAQLFSSLHHYVLMTFPLSHSQSNLDFIEIEWIVGKRGIGQISKVRCLPR